MALLIYRTLVIPAAVALFAVLTLATPPTAQRMPADAVLLLFFATGALWTWRVATVTPRFTAPASPVRAGGSGPNPMSPRT